MASSHYDFMPTLAEITGTEPPEIKDGISYFPTLLGKNNPPTTTGYSSEALVTTEKARRSPAKAGS